ncbi:benzoate/H(+) symporter BenE family transporter [Neisseria zalophi]|uniref:Benzoate transporter BenE n=1 Tax=Neisseria zalophi TaxID=640030 RepID=A0A5J6PWP1_9NEIS|nr:benzoate/H(+) symporter BenE family transporter [Neisseria zalophi]QEY25257.1 benzoate transporter BenE [Neisseria zalophi]
MLKLSDFSASHFSAAVSAILVSYVSAAAIIYQAALTLGASPTQIISWFTVMALACGLLTMILSIRYRMPVMVAWCTPGAAILAGMTGMPLAHAISGFIAASALMWLISAFGWFDRLVRMIPTPLVAAMLAGILLNFGSQVFGAMEYQPLLIFFMLVVFFLSKIRLPGYSVMLMLLAGVVYATWAGLFDWSQLEWRNPTLEWVQPAWDFGHIMSVGLPLFIASLATQNVPGMAIMHGYNYHPPARPLVESCAITTLLTAPLGNFTVNLAAISAAITMGSDVDKDPARRYLSNVILGVFYILIGLLGGVAVSLLSALPAELTAALAGIPIFAVLQANLVGAWKDETTREAALVTLLTSASGMTLLGISSPFWGLVFGMMVYWLHKKMMKHCKS